MKTLRRCAVMAGTVWLSAVGLQAAEATAPNWVTEAMKTHLSAYEAKVPGVYLLRELQIEVSTAGRVVETYRSVYKILTREGRKEASESELFLARTAKVRQVKGWMFGPSGELLKLDKEQEFDRAYISADLYDDLRVRGVDARAKADEGSVFAFEAVVESPVLFNQFDWYFQNRRDPVALSRYVVTLPEGWHAESSTFNHTAIEPTIEGSTYTWIARDIGYVQVEPSSPNVSSLFPRLAVSFSPPPGVTFPSPLFHNWQDVSQWMTAASAAQTEPNEEVTAKARDLTAASKTEAEKIRAIARYVQGTRYVSINLGLGRGGGYRPRPADETLRKEYGDCKDKATLMRALLKAAGIPSYLVLVSANDRTYVREEWPSPHQFNHVIVAIKASGDLGSNPVIEMPKVGRLLLFDPTAGSTPLGDLPISEQGGLALVVAGEGGELLRLPFQPAEASATEREIDAAIDQTGTLTVKLSDRLSGHSAVAERAVKNGRGPEELQKTLEHWISGGAAGARISKIDSQDHFGEGRFDLGAEFEVPGYGQIRGNRLMVFRPVMVGRRDAVFLTDPKRSAPVLLNPSRFHETVHIKLPENFKVDELPDGENFETPFGRYSAEFHAKDGELAFTRTFEVRPVSVPVAQYQALREFYERIRVVEQTPVVLARQ